jgi:hypothetical protein
MLLLRAPAGAMEGDAMGRLLRALSEATNLGNEGWSTIRRCLLLTPPAAVAGAIIVGTDVLSPTLQKVATSAWVAAGLTGCVLLSVGRISGRLTWPQTPFSSMSDSGKRLFAWAFGWLFAFGAFAAGALAVLGFMLLTNG